MKKHSGIFFWLTFTVVVGVVVDLSVVEVDCLSTLGLLVVVVGASVVVVGSGVEVWISVTGTMNRLKGLILKNNWFHVLWTQLWNCLFWILKRKSIEIYWEYRDFSRFFYLGINLRREVTWLVCGTHKKLFLDAQTLLIYFIDAFGIGN